PRSYLLDLHAAGELAGAKSHESDTISMVRVHVRLNLENECGHAGLGSQHGALVSRLRPRRRRQGGERIEQIADTEILECAAEKDRGHMARGKGARIQTLAGMAHQIKFPAQC